MLLCRVLRGAAGCRGAPGRLVGSAVVLAEGGGGGPQWRVPHVQTYAHDGAGPMTVQMRTMVRAAALVRGHARTKPQLLSVTGQAITGAGW